MMGIAQWNVNAPVTKGTSAVLVFSKDAESSYEQPPVCIRCGRCVNVCPMHLMPLYIAAAAQKDEMEKAEYYGATSCVECGSCAYSCPGHMPIVQYIRTAKESIKAAHAAQKVAAAVSEEKEDMNDVPADDTKSDVESASQ
ncbi:MAG: 4Fe-4S dicluster domain-containing protein, partial [Clostridia bacterium]|nr:4Fe-4S dicluster domain-containing protein [Clostridia bacterium]